MRALAAVLCLAFLPSCAEPIQATDAGPTDTGGLVDGGGDAGDAGSDATTPNDLGGADSEVDAGPEDGGAGDAGCMTSCFSDLDEDGFAPANATSILACTCPTETTSLAPTTTASTDCDDSQLSVGPASDTNPMRCGECDQACDGDPHGDAACSLGMCTLDCDAGYALDGDACTIIDAPRLVAPLSTTTSTSRRPMFRWELSGVADGARVQLCTTRACTTVSTEFNVVGSSGQPPADLSPGLHYWRLRGRAGAEVGVTTSPVWQVRVPPRSAPTVNVGWGHEPDFNGDGFADVVVGAQLAVSDVGRVHVYHGSSLGPAMSPDVSLDSPGGASGSFGARVISTGDVDGDGLVDMAVLAPGAFGGGRVYWYRGSALGVGATPDATLPPAAAGGKIGFGLAAGDINGDGYSDIVTGGTPSGSVNGGLLHVFYGGPDGPSIVPDVTRNSPSGDESFAYFVDVGDFDGDGFGDVFVSAINHASTGLAYVYRGGSGGLTSAPSTTMSNPLGSGFLGQGGLAAVGDLNGDGRGDAITGLQNSSDDRVYVYYGGGAGLPSAPSLTITSPGGCCFASSIPPGSTRGDVNRDGYSDLLFGNANYPSSGADRQGRAYVFYGGPTGVAGTPQVELANPDGTNANFGVSSSLADVDGDGFADALVGSYLNVLSGHVHVHRGSGLGVSTTRSWLLAGPDGAGALYGAFIAARLSRQSAHWRRL